MRNDEKPEALDPKMELFKRLDSLGLFDIREGYCTLHFDGDGNFRKAEWHKTVRFSR